MGRGTHLDTVDSRTFFVDDYGVDVTAEDYGYSCLVFPLGGLAEVHESTADAYNDI